jgi:hypothetical protein
MDHALTSTPATNLEHLSREMRERSARMSISMAVKGERFAIFAGSRVDRRYQMQQMRDAVQRVFHVVA